VGRGCVGVVVPSDSLEGGGTPGLDELGFQGSWFLCDLQLAAVPVPGRLVLRMCVRGLESGERKAVLQSSE